MKKRYSLMPSRPTLRHAFHRIHLVITFIILSVVGLFLSLLALLAMQKYAENSLKLIATTIAHTAQAAVVFQDKTAANEILELIAVHDGFTEAKIFDAKQQVLARWQANQETRTGNFKKLVEHWLFPEPFTLPIYHHQQKVGAVWLIGNSDHIIKFIYQALLVLFACLLFSAVISLYLSLRMHDGIVRALQNITAVAHDVRQRRTFSRRVPSAHIAELHELSQVFNHLLEELEEWQHHLQTEKAVLTWQAQHDSLTGLPNRATFERVLSTVMSDKFMRESAAILFIDGNRLKYVNDIYGHAAGDHVLVTIAATLRRRVRKTDTVARLGGDEFAILLPSANLEDAERVAKNIIHAMDAPILLPNGQHLRITLSIGIALSNGELTAEQLLSEADAAMYHIKQRGGGWYSADTTKLNYLSRTPL
ncbi:diguanylate cyclase domain-containing protein [Xenorhabdus eapokensis]|uniref:Sensory box/GGDEF family protein SrcC n=1 Tax=Xenorhabdus eapokensis TaxID=1873482 RepID=A0A1Q5TZA9_9GAMM|nr:diguanylate cyclase [Xenorhabdus eapokensis]OKP05566.1 sensory box/GGDEF family protein SrcC [Xenorhabdus eapokensis]